MCLGCVEHSISTLLFTSLHASYEVAIDNYYSPFTYKETEAEVSL